MVGSRRTYSAGQSEIALTATHLVVSTWRQMASTIHQYNDLHWWRDPDALTEPENTLTATCLTESTWYQLAVTVHRYNHLHWWLDAVVKITLLSNKFQICHACQVIHYFIKRFIRTIQKARKAWILKDYKVLSFRPQFPCWNVPWPCNIRTYAHKPNFLFPQPGLYLLRNCH